MTHDLKEALEFFTEGHHCDAYDDPAAAQHFGKVLAREVRRLGSERDRMREVLRESRDVLLDYINKLEVLGGFMGYGRSVVQQIDATLTAPSAPRESCDDHDEGMFCSTCRKKEGSDGGR